MAGLLAASAARRASCSACVLLALLPASIAMLGFGEPAWQAINPVTLFGVVRGLGPYYLAAARRDARLRRHSRAARASACSGRHRARDALLLRDLVLQPRRRLRCTCAASSSDTNPAAAPSARRRARKTSALKLRAKMVDDVFQQVRIGKHVDATAPLARWLRDTGRPNYASRMRCTSPNRPLRWDYAAGAQHHRQHADPAPAARRPPRRRAGGVRDPARTRTRTSRMDSAADLRTLAEYAESTGANELAQSMRLETPVFHPRS